MTNWLDRATVRTGLFIKVELPAETLLFSDVGWEITLNGDPYTPLGNLISVGSTLNEITNSSDSVTITVTGIPNSSVTKILTAKIKGSPVTIQRGFYDSISAAPLTPYGVLGYVTRFKGYVNNFSINEEYNVEARESFLTVGLECKSWIDLLRQKRSGRQTNEISMKKFFPSDNSFNRLWSLSNSKFDFGKFP